MLGCCTWMVSCPGTLLQRRLQKLGPSLSQSDFRVLARSQFGLAGAKFPDLGEQAGRDALDAIIEACEIGIIPSSWILLSKIAGPLGD